MNTEQRKERMVCVCAYFMFHVKFAKYAVKEKMESDENRNTQVLCLKCELPCSYSWFLLPPTGQKIS